VAKPFLKWAGGKRWLISSGIQYAPVHYKTYREPFLGGGAAFFDQEPDDFVLSDLNGELIACYQGIKESHKKFQTKLSEHDRHHSPEYYYKVRDAKPTAPYSKAARFVYLNRTCFNGLYRVNRQGKFNVPIGTATSAKYEKDDFKSVANLLSKGTLLNSDFAKNITNAKKGDFLFVDPPYTVRHNANGFIQYNEKIFSWQDQIRLRDLLVAAAKRGAKATITNANHPSVIELYENYGNIEVTSRASLISGNTNSRGKTTEILIRLGWKVTQPTDVMEGEIVSVVS